MSLNTLGVQKLDVGKMMIIVKKAEHVYEENLN